jgi:hypothetical protein
MNARVPTTLLNTFDTLAHVTRAWDSDITQRITDYIAIPAKSPGFDADWAAHGHIDTVMRNAADWVAAQKIDGLTLEVLRLNKPDGTPRTPVLFFEIPAHQHASTHTVLMYAPSGPVDRQARNRPRRCSPAVWARQCRRWLRRVRLDCRCASA